MSNIVRISIGAELSLARSSWMARVARAQQKALAIAVRNNKTEQRFSGLLARLIS